MSRFEVLAWIGSRIGKPRGWERVVRMLMPPESCRSLGEIELVRDGLSFTTRPSVPIGWHVTFFGTYEPDSRALFRTLLKPGGTAIDVGANVGWHTLLMARLVGPNGKVLAVEANPSIRAKLAANLETNALRNVRVFPVVLGPADGEVEFYGPDADDPDSGNGHVGSDSRSRHVASKRLPQRPLDAIVDEAGLDHVRLLKIDVEGYEWPVLRGSERTIARHRPHIVFEYIEEYAHRGGARPEELAGFFRRHRYRLRTLARGGPQPILAGAWPRCADIWAAPEEE